MLKGRAVSASHSDFDQGHSPITMRLTMRDTS